MNERDEELDLMFARVRRPAADGGRWPLVRARIGEGSPYWLPLLALFPGIRLLLLAGGFPALSALKVMPVAAAILLFTLLRTNPFRVEPRLAGE
jgi:hypothetical protein